ncbi:hypothetical protein ES703_112881 [subsurface metagenome]
MVMKTGVEVTAMNGRFYDILEIVERCATASGCEGYITTLTSEGEKGRFADRRNVLVVEIKRAQNVSLMYRKMKEIIGPNYNIVEDNGIIRIKWDPEREKGNEKCQ